MQLLTRDQSEGRKAMHREIWGSAASDHMMMWCEKWGGCNASLDGLPDKPISREA
jgi:hypothetical protein